jgi:hypothetical protein
MLQATPTATPPHYDQRQFLIRLSQKYVQKGRGSSVDSPVPINTVMLLQFKEALQNVPYLLVGGLATHHYMPARMTLDADILILTKDQQQVENCLESYYYQKKGTLSIGGSTWVSATGEVLDVLTQQSDWAEEALHNPNMIDNMPVMAMPYLVLMKLLAGRMQDLADITRMLGAANDQTLNEVRQTIQKYQPEALEDIESMIVLGKLEYQ